MALLCGLLLSAVFVFGLWLLVRASRRRKDR